MWMAALAVLLLRHPDSIVRQLFFRGGKIAAKFFLHFLYLRARLIAGCFCVKSTPTVFYSVFTRYERIVCRPSSAVFPAFASRRKALESLRSGVECVVRPSLAQTMRHAAACKCPRCGMGPLFRGWVKLHPRCPHCGLTYYPESGFYLGGMIINYVVTVIIVIAVYLTSLLLPPLLPWSINIKILVWIAFTIVLSLLLWRHSQSFWLALNYWVEPREFDDRLQSNR
jgi:uncharacterized protein (DUF983 family)